MSGSWSTRIVAWVRRQVPAAALTVVALAGATVVTAVLEHLVRVPYAAPVYLLAVLIVGLLGGTIPAVLTGLASFLLYDFLFLQPPYNLTVADPSEWLNLLVFLVVAVAIGRLAALQATQATQAAERAREAVALFRISRSISTAEDYGEGARSVLAELASSIGMDRVWLALGTSPAEERVVADTGAGTPLPIPRWSVVLQRRPGDEPATWARTHVGKGVQGAGLGSPVVHRIRVEVPGEVLGSLWALRADADLEPDRAETRILSAAADQLGQAVQRDRLARHALDAEVARSSEALKTALLDSVSHDLRTPLATIRAAAGSLLDSKVTWTDAERADALRSIDAEAERMNRLVRDLLDLSRIEGGALRPELEPHDLDEVVARVVKRVAPGGVRVEVPDDLPPLLVDVTYLDEILTNILENAARHGGSLVRIRAQALPDRSAVAIHVDDDGPGVSEADLPHLFEKFYRVRQPGESARHGMGIGLTVAQGLTRSMDGQIDARRSEFGGVAIVLRLPSVEMPAETESESPNPLSREGDEAAAGAGT